MKKLVNIILFSICITFITACDEEKSEEESVNVEYTILNDEQEMKDKIKHKIGYITTDATEQKKIENLTKLVMFDYRLEDLDSIHMYIYAPNAEGELGHEIAESFAAFAREGALKIGVERAYEFKIELK